MSMELEDRIRSWVDDHVVGVEPVTVDEALNRASAPSLIVSTAGSRRRWTTAAVAAAAVVLAGAIGFVAVGGDAETRQVVAASSGVEQGSSPVPATRPEVGEPVDGGQGTGETPDGGGGQIDDGWTRFVEPTIGWAWEQPAGWSVQSQRGYCPEADGGGLNSTFVSNSVHRYPYEVFDPDRTEELGCAAVPPRSAGLVWSLPEPLPSDFVGIGLVSQRRDLSDMELPDGSFPFPLSLERIVGRNAIEVPGGEGWTSFLLRDDGWYRLMVYLGSDVSDLDRAALDRLIASMEETGDPTAHPIRFSWQPTGAEVVASSPPDSLSRSASARLALPDVATATDEGRWVEVHLGTVEGALLFTRADMESSEPEVDLQLNPGSPVHRERIVLRGVEVVHDSANDGDLSVSRLIFFDYDDLAVEVRAQNVSDDDLFRIIEGLQLVAVGGQAE